AKQLPVSTNTVPEFEIIQETTSYRVFVLDTSGSMQGERLKTLRHAMENVIQQLILKGSWVGIVTFGTTATVKKDLTEINTQQDRKNLISVIPDSASGRTCMGCGMIEAKKLLTKKLGTVSQGEIILISDGEDSSDEPDAVNVHVNDARQEVINAKITVHTIAISQQADHLLGDIARETGGKYYTYLDNGGISLLGAFSETLSGGLTSARNKNVMLMAHKMNSVDTNQHNISFALEKGLGGDTTFSFITPTDTDVKFELTGPNDYNQFIESHGSITTLSIPGTAQAGEYEMIVTTGTMPRTVEYFAKSDATSDDIVRVTSLLSTSNIDLSTGDLPIIFSEVSKGYLPILNATVTAHVETGNHICDVKLMDDGIDPDSFIDDGIYSGYIFPTCLHSGRVNVKVDVKGAKGETQVLQSVTGAPNPEEGDIDERTEVYDSSFQRVQILEQLNVTNYKNITTSDDLIAPGKITDVNIHHIQSKALSNSERRNCTISWTATGDDKTIGRASSYIFRIADDVDVLLNDFDNAPILEVGNNSLIPKPSGDIEVLKITVDAEESYTGTAFFALQAVDETGNKGSVSNIISIVVAK
ncbi:calcium-activated chloride channel regulator 4-like, partial [Ruditapes philippinarum]|uniref:calcium-activated chloride channel regulator 4-like n=1 Tax=Ruditapes philippinarum TaxID=129788 RepID=UPI00295BE75A